MILKWIKTILKPKKPPDIRYIDLYENKEYKQLIRYLEICIPNITEDYVKRNYNTDIYALYDNIVGYKIVSDTILESITKHKEIRNSNLPKINKRYVKFKNILTDQEGYVLSLKESKIYIQDLISDLINIIHSVNVEMISLKGFNSIYIKQYIINMLMMIDELEQQNYDRRSDYETK